MASFHPLLDEARLDRQTFGDAELRREVLQLFLAQLAELESKLRAAGAAELRGVLHTLKGSSRAVGALALAQHADEMEAGTADAAALRALHRLMSDTAHAVARRLS